MLQLSSTITFFPFTVQVILGVWTRGWDAATFINNYLFSVHRPSDVGVWVRWRDAATYIDDFSGLMFPFQAD
jgi:hypothetical protein